MRCTVHQLLAVLLLTACGRFEFEGHTDARAGEGDAAPWAGAFTLEPPVLVPELSTTDYDLECYVVPDGKRIYFASFIEPTTLGFQDLFTAERSDIDSPWTNVTHLVDLSTATGEGRLTTVDGLRAYFWSERMLPTSNIWTVSRASTSVPFMNADAELVAGLSDTGFSEYDPWVSRDGARMYYSDDNGSTDVYVADGVAPNQFANQRSLPGINTPFDEDNPTLSADERFIVFSTNRVGGGSSDLYYARRSDVSAMFGTPQPLPVVNTADDETEPCLSDQGELFFSSNRGDGLQPDIYRSRFIPQ